MTSRSSSRFGHGVTRREMLAFFPVGVLGGRAASLQLASPEAALRTRSLSHVSLNVTDVSRSVDFYQRVFGLPVQARYASTTVLRVGAGPQFIAITGTRPGVASSIGHFGMTIEGFEPDRTLEALAAAGVANATSESGTSLSGGALRARILRREPGGAAELFLGDPGGIIVQLQAPGYCGGTGDAGNRCMPVERPREQGLLSLQDLSHFTMRTPIPERAVRFYREVFGMRISAYQGTTPALAVGSGRQFIMMSSAGVGANASAEPVTSAFIHHVCFTVDGFNVDRIFRVLAECGLKPRGQSQAAPPPMTYYVSMRMPDRGGDQAGTPELYFADPDGILIQLQDPAYCGGGGVLGERCL